ncbi:outer membrane protein [Bartonella sp. A05]|uniref:outer membrane protein n=1 Tax=Bartonella sp. A05 TaxID=2967261 RepID=UPI0022A91D98|nr:outer membrane protein [Bartonella sp. A05]MCZ2204024.1 porin family protein [Bartonella sp. A05]
MNTKYFIAVSVFAFFTAFVAQAADIVVPREPIVQEAMPVVAPTFSWTGFYLGGQIAALSSDSTLRGLQDARVNSWIPVDEELHPKISGLIEGLYVGSDIDFGNGIILGADTDVILSEHKDTKIIDHREQKYFKQREVFKHTLKQKWSGSSRLRVGFASDHMFVVGHIMPYIAGGIAYTRLQHVVVRSMEEEEQEMPFETLSDEKNTMVGYTLGAGVELAMLSNIILRAEYRYSDFGKKEFAKKAIEVDYKTNDFRIGVAYKF